MTGKGTVLIADVKEEGRSKGFAIKLAGWPTFKQNCQGRIDRGCWEEKHFSTGGRNIENTETNSDWEQISKNNW